jgi:hypothetical protein
VFRLAYEKDFRQLQHDDLRLAEIEVYYGTSSMSAERSRQICLKRLNIPSPLLAGAAANAESTSSISPHHILAS